jgi:hypothetical protein
MATHGTRSHGEARLIAALLEGRPVHEAAHAAGLSETTAHRRLRDAAFRAQLAAARQAALSAAILRLVAATGTAADELVRLTTAATQESIRLASARSVLDFALKGTELLEIDARLTALEQAQEARTNGHHAFPTG